MFRLVNFEDVGLIVSFGHTVRLMSFLPHSANKSQTRGRTTQKKYQRRAGEMKKSSKSLLLFFASRHLCKHFIWPHLHFFIILRISGETKQKTTETINYFHFCKDTKLLIHFNFSRSARKMSHYGSTCELSFKIKIFAQKINTKIRRIKKIRYFWWFSNDL